MVAGSVDDFTPTVTLSIREKMADELELDVSKVALVVTAYEEGRMRRLAGQVLLEFTITVEDAAAASDAFDTMNEQLANTETASAFLSTPELAVTVTSVEVATSAVVPPAPPKADTTTIVEVTTGSALTEEDDEDGDSAMIAVLLILVVVLLAAVAAIVYFRLVAGKTAPKQPQAAIGANSTQLKTTAPAIGAKVPGEMMPADASSAAEGVEMADEKT